MKAVNFKADHEPVWHELINRKFIAVYLAIGLVLIINQLVFGTLLKDREKAKAFTAADGSQYFNTLASGGVVGGTNNKLVADFWFPDATSANVACNYTLAGNPCVTMLDADGTATAGAGVDDDGAATIFQMMPPNTPLLNIAVKASDNICTDSLTAPTCIYNNSGSASCNDGSTKYYLLGAACTAPGDVLVGGADHWLHSELVAANGAYDFGASAATTETLWLDNLKSDTVLLTGSAWTGNNQNQWQNDTPGSWFGPGGKATFVDIGNTHTFTGAETVIRDKDLDDKYTDAADILMDANGSGAGIGVNDEIIADGTDFQPIKQGFGGKYDNICINTEGLGGVGQVIIYYDDSDFNADGLKDGVGADCIPGNGGTDILIRDDTNTGLPGIIAGFGTFPFTFGSAQFLLGYNDLNSNGKWDFGSNAATTESLWMNGTGNVKFNANIDVAVEADGTGSVGAGADDDAITRGSNLMYLQPIDGVCGAYNPALNAIEDLYVDGNLNCIPGDGGVDVILQDVTGDGLNPASIFGGTWMSEAGSLAFYDFLPPIGPGAWVYGANAASTETLWFNSNILNYKYSSAPDEDIYGMGNVIGGDLLNPFNLSFGPAGYGLIYADADGSGTLTSADTILEDNGNIWGGPVAPLGNGKIDRMDDRINYWTIKNAGTATGADIPKLYLWQDPIFGNGICDLGVGPGANDSLLGQMNWNSATNTWDFDGSVLPPGTNSFGRFCVSADFSFPGDEGKTFIPQIPQSTDGLGPNNYLHDAGEVGWFFYSKNVGPNGGSITLPYTFTIHTSPSYSGGGVSLPGSADTTAPGMVTNVVITADSQGNVSISWQDPSDTDLSQIQIEENLDGTLTTSNVAKGVQAKTLTGRIVGKTYTYRLRAQDTSGNLSLGQYYDVTIPATGTAQAQVQALPAPQTPLILQDPIPAGPLPSDVSVGELVKSAASGTIYFIDQDNRRHTFPNESVYHSYFADFSGLQTVSVATLAAIPVGSNVTMRPGTWLVKIQSDPKVYAVEPYGVLRWISSETIAAALYGTNWSTKIADVNPSFFIDYQTGDPVITNIHPTGSAISYQGETKVYYIDQGKKSFISNEVFVNNKFQNKFVIRNISPTITYSDAADLLNQTMAEIMTLR